ncbi:MAG: YqgE/AlgH family protein [Burkholderiales bacterium]|nr:YqgE/AlgH family protein [Burkholderiales bacterium]
MRAKLNRLCAVLAGCVVLGFAAAPVARAADVTEPVMLVANPKLGEFYRATVLVVRPVGNGQHIGFIVNRPTQMTLGKLFPDHPPSAKVSDPVYLGGPVYVDTIFALVQREASPGGKSIPLFEDLHVAVDATTVDDIIEHDAEHARFFAGMVAWRPGELAQELERGLWYVQRPDAKLLFRKSTEGLWEELVQPHRGNAI